MPASKSYRKSCKSNITWCLLKRQQSHLSYEEHQTILRYGVSQTTQIRRAYPCKLPGTPRTTFFIAFSPDGETIALGHGDHTVRVSEVKTGRCLKILNGHPRSPWCLVFHPSNPHLLASGCLGGVVNVWDLTREDDHLITSLDCHKVISIAFHPTEMLLLVASGNQLLFWSWYQPEPFATLTSASVDEQVRIAKFDSLGHHILTAVRQLTFNTSSTSELDNAASQPHEDAQVIRTSVVHVNFENAETTVENVITEGPTKPPKKRMMDLDHPCRLQWWDFTHLEFPDLKERDLNVIAHNCKLYNDAGADISRDDRLLCALVNVEVEGRAHLSKVCVFSLQENNLGQCLHFVTLEYNTFSACFSPLSTHILVGVSCDAMLEFFQENPAGSNLALIFKLCENGDKYSENAVQPLTKVASFKLQNHGRRAVFTMRANAALWHPLIEYGLIAFGTNEGEVFFVHV